VVVLNIVSKSNSISVVIPTLNEEAELPETIRRARTIAEVSEIIVADGGSTDGTRAIAFEAGCIVVESEAGRGKQLRAGSERATGDVVLLLHADTWLPVDAGRAALALLNRSGVVAGGFWKRFRKGAPIAIRGARVKCWLLLLVSGYVFGDQGFFLRRETLREIGGVPPVPLMEELELCKRLRVMGRIELADATVITSWRKFAKHGVLRTYLLMWRVLRAYRRGVPVEELERVYREGR